MAVGSCATEGDSPVSGNSSFGSADASADAQGAGLFGSTGGTNTGTGTGGGPAGGSCDPNFCPSNGTGTPCCVTANGPCGTDLGTGCMAAAAPDSGF